MAETRKHRIEVRDELDKALLAALGEPARPVEPGSQPQPLGDGGAEPAASDPGRPHTTPFVTPGSSMGGFTFGPTDSKKA